MTDSAAPPALIAKILPWVARIAWVAVAVVGGGAVDSALDGRSTPVTVVGYGGFWTIFGLVALALAIPSVLSLTVARVLAPLQVGVAIGAILFEASATDVILLLAPAVIATAAIFSPEVGRWMVQASAYGDEERLPLRSPVPVGAAAIAMWLVWSFALLIGPLALAARGWGLGVVLTLLALAGAVLVGPRWHKMSKRWFVLVPAGVVLHDPVVLADTLMVRSHQLAGLGLARADTEAADLTGPASGYALQVDTSETVTTVFAFTPSEPNGRAIHLTGFLVAPSRPGEALRLAKARGLPVQ